MIKFLMIMGIIHLVSIIIVIILLALFFIIDFYQNKKKNSNIEILIDEEINKSMSFHSEVVDEFLDSFVPKRRKK